jgi:hypothetical protein
LLAVATPGGITPWGVCLLGLAEFSPDLAILLVDADQPQRVARTSLGQLLPFRFRLDA